MTGNLYMLYEHRMAIQLWNVLQGSEAQGRSVEEDILGGGTFAFLDDIFLYNDAKVTKINTPKLKPVYTGITI